MKYIYRILKIIGTIVTFFIIIFLVSILYSRFVIETKELQLIAPAGMKFAELG